MTHHTHVRAMLPAALLLIATVIPASRALSQADRVSLVLEEGISGAVWDVALSSDGRTLYSCGRDSTAKAWNTATGESTHCFRAPKATLITSIALARDDRTHAFGDMNGHVVVWNATSGALLADIPAHNEYVHAVAFSPDGRYLYSAGHDDKVCVWDAATGRIVRTIETKSVWVNDLALSHDGTKFATAGQDGTIKVWSASSGSLLFSPGYHPRLATSVCFSNDDAYVLSGGRDGSVRVWDVKRRVMSDELRMEGGSPRSLAIDRSTGDMLAVCMMNGLVQTWEWRKNRLVSTVRRSYGAMAAELDRKAKRMYTAHTDGSVKVWNSEDGTLLANMVGFNNGQWLTYTPDGYYDCSTSGDVYVKWRTSDGLFPLDQYASVYKQPGTVEDALAGSYVSATRVERVVNPPSISILSPHDRQLFAFGSEPREILLDVRATDAKKVERLGITLNGRSLREGSQAQSEVIERSDTALALRYRITVLPGINVIEATALNSARVRSRKAAVTVRVETQDKLPPNMFVLAVGIDEYAPQFPDLKYASLDARKLGEVLARQEGGMYTRVYSTVLTNKEATKDRILSALAAFPKMSASDVLVMFFGGHGARVRTGRESAAYYFVTSGAAKDKLAKTGLNWADLSRAVSGMNAGRVILLLDACHSGAVSAGASNEKVAAALAGDLGIVFSSSSGSEYSYENQSWGHGAFTKALLDGLAGGADYTKDKIIDWNELQLFVSKTVQELTGGAQNPMVPRLEQFVPFEFARLK